MGALGTAVQNFYYLHSKIPYNVQAEDLFVIPFFAGIGNLLADSIEDDDELARTFFIFVMFSVTLFGGVIYLAGGTPLLRIAEFMPSELGGWWHGHR